MLQMIMSNLSPKVKIKCVFTFTLFYINPRWSSAVIKKQLCSTLQFVTPWTARVGWNFLLFHVGFYKLDRSVGMIVLFKTGKQLPSIQIFDPQISISRYNFYTSVTKLLLVSILSSLGLDVSLECCRSRVVAWFSEAESRSRTFGDDGTAPGPRRYQTAEIWHEGCSDSDTWRSFGDRLPSTGAGPKQNSIVPSRLESPG